MISRRSLLATIAGAGLAAPPRLAAASDRFASPWSETSHASIRLIAGAEGLAGLEFRLAPGFKTYWRDPGDSGVPPHFDWSGSQNVARIDVLWPAPHRFIDGSGFYIGYYGPLVMPLRVVAVAAAKPVMLRLRIDYAVCESMCIPAQGAAELALKQAAESPYAAPIAEAMAKVPVRLALGAAAPRGFAFERVALGKGKKAMLAVDVVMPRDATGFDLFAEGPKGAFFGQPTIEYPMEQPTTAGLVRRRFLSRVEQSAKGHERWPLLLTLTADGGAVELEATVDAPY